MACCPAAPQAHQNERRTAGNHGESSPARRRRDSAVHPGRNTNWPRMPTASQADGSGISRSGPAVVARSGRRHWQRGQGRWGCSETHACVVGRRTHRRGWLSAAEVQDGAHRGCRPPSSAAELGRLWAVRGRSPMANDDHQAHDPTAPGQQKPSSPRYPARPRARRQLLTRPLRLDRPHQVSGVNLPRTQAS